MKLIIDIPEEDYKLICSDGRPFLPSYKWIKKGIPLDKIRTEIDKAIWEDVVVCLDGTDEVRIPRLDPDDVFEIIDKYRKEQE